MGRDLTADQVSQLRIGKRIENADQIGQLMAAFDQHGAEGQGDAQVGNGARVITFKGRFGERFVGVGDHVQSNPWPGKSTERVSVTGHDRP